MERGAANDSLSAFADQCQSGSLAHRGGLGSLRALDGGGYVQEWIWRLQAHHDVVEKVLVDRYHDASHLKELSSVVFIGGNFIGRVVVPQPGRVDRNRGGLVARPTFRVISVLDERGPVWLINDRDG